MDTDIEQRLTVAAVLLGYPKEALVFVLGGWSHYDIYTQTPLGGKELCWRLHDAAIEMYGNNAREQLREWKITTTADFGVIVYGLVENGFIRKDNTDHLADFDDVFDFQHQFVVPRIQTVRRPQQWSLLTLFVATMLAAVAASGFSQAGLEGMWSALGCFWFVSLGIGLLLTGIAYRARGRFWLVCCGAVSCGAGWFMFSTLSCR